MRRVLVGVILVATVDESKKLLMGRELSAVCTYSWHCASSTVLISSAESAGTADNLYM